MGPITAKVFKAGNSKALRPPRSLDVKAKAHEVTPTATGFTLTDPKAEARRLKAVFPRVEAFGEAAARASCARFSPT